VVDHPERALQGHTVREGWVKILMFQVMVLFFVLRNLAFRVPKMVSFKSRADMNENKHPVFLRYGVLSNLGSEWRIRY
jgi:hypothetical protein